MSGFTLPPLTEIAAGSDGGMLWAAELRGGQVWGLHRQIGDEINPVGSVWSVRVARLAPDRRGAIVTMDATGQEGFLDLSQLSTPPHEGARLPAQVSRAAEAGKRTTLSAMIRLSGRYLVYSPGKPGVAVSRQVQDREAGKRLQSLARRLAESGEGLVVRAAASTLGQAAEAAITSELACHREYWQHIREAAGLGCIMPPPAFWQRLLTERRGTGPLTLSTGSALLARQLDQIAEAVAPGEEIRVRHESGNWRQLSGAADAFATALEAEAPLPGGGRLWIERTRACWTIDVDSSGAANDRLSLNKSAAVEAARQVRLRNASGPIVVDFLRLNDGKAEAAVIADLRAAFAEDPAALRFNDRFDRLGFYAFSRQRIGAELVG